MSKPYLDAFFDALGVPQDRRRFERVLANLDEGTLTVYIDTDIGVIPVTMHTADLGLTPERPNPSELQDLLETSNWLDTQYKTHGSFPKLLAANGIHPDLAQYAHQYAYKKLLWRQTLGTVIKRWEVICHYYASPNPDERPNPRDLADEYELSFKSVYRYINRAALGDFFGRLKYNDLNLIQDYKRHSPAYIFFPGSPLSPEDFLLPNAKGWPNLPLGLVSDLLPRLSLELLSIQLGENLTLTLQHHDKICLQLKPHSTSLPFPEDISSLHFSSTENSLHLDLYAPKGSYSSDVTLVSIIEASSGARYKPV